MRVTAIEVAAESRTYAWDPIEASLPFDRRTLFSDRVSEDVPVHLLGERIGKTFSEITPAAVAIPGWSTPAALTALRWCLEHEVPAILLSETTAYDFERRWWKEWPKRRLVQQFAAALVGGRDHRHYLKHLGMPARAITKGYDVVDTIHFADGARKARQQLRTIRQQFNLPARYVLASARFIPKKNLPRLIAAYAHYRGANDHPWDLVLLGDGPERPAVEAAIARKAVEAHVHLPGFQQYDVLPAYYGAAEAFIHASTTEQWGLVVNEAMAAGLPVGVSRRCGCACELVREGRNGWTFDPFTVEDIASVLTRLHTSVNSGARLGEVSKEIITDWGPDRFGEGLHAAVKHARQEKETSTTAVDRLLIKLLIRQ